MKSRKRKQPRTSTVLLFALIIFLLGIYLISYNYLVGKKEKIYSSMNLLLFEDEKPKDLNVEVESSANESTIPDVEEAIDLAVKNFVNNSNCC